MSSRFGFGRRHHPEDGAGWIYADLFLALMVVGLGSAVITASAPSGGATATTAPPTFQLSCVEFPVKVPANVKTGGPRIETAITEELQRRGWTADQAKPGLVIVMGGFGGGETPGDGDGRAKARLGALRASTPLLERVEMRTGGAQVVTVNGKRVTVGGAGSYLMVVYLLFSGPVLEEDCTT
ncbi:MAG: hypothetical protein ACKOBO_06085 [Acidimicrobiales bacterium]